MKMVDCFQGREGTQPKLLGPDIYIYISSGGVFFLLFYVKGWGPKSSVCSSKPGKPNLPGYPGGARKV